MRPSILWDGHSSRYRVPGLPARGRTGDEKGVGGKTRQSHDQPHHSRDHSSETKESRDPQELLKRVLVYMYLYNSCGWAQ